MRAAFRVDAGTAIGTGHIMRCLTLARVLMARGTDVAFLTRRHPGGLAEMVEGHGIPVLALQPPRGVGDDPSTWLGAEIGTDAAETLSHLEKHGHVDWLIVDHYAIGGEWEEALAPAAGRILVIDDLADRAHFCDLLVDQTYRREERRYGSLVPDRCRCLLGPGYALLRAEFREARQGRRVIEAIDKVFVYFGGTDRTNQSAAVLEALSPWAEDVEVTVVAGRWNPHVPDIRAKISLFRRHSLVVENRRMARLMVRADVAFGAGGVSTFERLAVGLPSIVVTVAQNQEGVTGQLAREGYIRLLGPDTDTPVERWRQAFQAVTLSDLNRMSERGMLLVDGWGTERVARHLLGESGLPLEEPSISPSGMS